MKTIEEFLRNIFSEANWDYGELEEFDSDITDTIKEKTKLFIQEAIKADRINLLEHVTATLYRSENDERLDDAVVDEDSLLNAPNIELK